MAILAFQKPDKVIMLEGTATVGRFEFRPLEPGYGQTIGNALRYQSDQDLRRGSGIRYHTWRDRRHAGYHS